MGMASDDQRKKRLCKKIDDVDRLMNDVGCTEAAAREAKEGATAGAMRAATVSGAASAWPEVGPEPDGQSAEKAVGVNGKVQRLKVEEYMAFYKKRTEGKLQP